jgi:hypothetical protein
MPASLKRAPIAPAMPCLSPFSPMNWWRSHRPDAFSRKDVNHIRRAMIGTEIAEEQDWRRAILGDAPIAIGIAVRQLKAKPISALEIDLALSAVLCCGLEGNAASAILISSALRRRSKIDPPCRPLSLLWLVADF